MASDTKAQIRDLENRRFQAMCAADAKTLGELLADSMIYTHSTSAVDTKTSYLQGIRDGKWKYRKIERPVEDIQVHGDCAIVTGQVRIELAERVLNSRYTNVWVKGTRGWQMVAWQSTPIPA